MSQFIEMFKDKKTNGKIADLVDTDIKSVKKSFNKDDLIEYIDISSVNAKSRTLNETTQYIVSSAPSRAQQCVQNGDILVSTVRPINRNVAVVDRDLTNLVASTGFCVLRPKDGYREYLLAIVTSDKYTDKMCDIASGGLYPAVNNGDVLSYDIFIPDKDFLNRVTQIYRQADKSGFDGHKSQFIEMTGDPRTNPKGWPVKTLSELATYSIGLTYKPENISEEGTIVLRSGNIQKSKIDLADVVRVNCPIKESIYVQKNDILMCSRNGSAALVGKVAQIKDISEPMTYGAFMTVIRSEYSDFLYLYFQSNDFREQVSTGKSSTMNQITQNMLDKISLPLPDDETRNKLSIILHQADKSGSVLLKLSSR